jgi:hypothetical protein
MVHRQLHHAAHDVLKLLDQFGLANAVSESGGELSRIRF